VRLRQQIDVMLKRWIMDQQWHQVPVVELGIWLNRGDRHPVKREQGDHEKKADR
jgi:hypothetical protein